MAYAPSLDQARSIEHHSAGVGDLDVGAIGDGFEEAEQRDFVGSEAGRGGGRRSNLRDMYRSAGEGGEDESVREGLVAGEAQRRLGCGHGMVLRTHLARIGRENGVALRA